MSVIDKFVIFLFCFVVGTLADACWGYDSDDRNDARKEFQCSFGCFGSSNNRYCCFEITTEFVLLFVVIIAGVALGFLAAVRILTIVISFICHRYWKRKRGAQVHVISPFGGSTVTSQTYQMAPPANPGAYYYGHPYQNQRVVLTQPRQQLSPFVDPKPSHCSAVE